MKRYILYKRTLKPTKTRTKSRVIYYAIMRDENGKQLGAVSTGCTNKTAAEAWIEREITKADAESRRRKNPILEDFARDFFIWDYCTWIKRAHAQGRLFSRPVADSRRVNLTKYVFPRFGSMRLDEIKAKDIADWLLSLDLSNQSKNHILYSMRIVFDEAVFQELLPANPIRNLKPFNLDPTKGNRIERSVFTPDELARILSALDRFWALFFFLALRTGMREGELRALAWFQVLWEERVILVSRAVKADGSIGLPKGNRARAVPFELEGDRVFSMLSEWNSTNEPSINDLVFPGPTSTSPVSRKVAHSILQKAMKQARIDRTGRKLDVHALRTTFTTETAKRYGQGLASFLLGHQSVNTTQKHYDQTTPLESLRLMLPKP